MTIEDGPRGDLEFGTSPRALALAAERSPDLHAVEDGDVTLSFADLAARVRDAAKGLIALDVGHGDRVAIWAPNVWEWIVATLATHSVGGVVVPINTRYRGIEAAYLLQKSRAKVLFTVSGFLDTDYVAMLRDSGEHTPDLAHVVLLRGEPGPDTLPFAKLTELGATVSDSFLAARTDAVSPDDLADVIFTSGTTGKPKGVMCTHAQNLRTFRTWSDIVGLREGDRYLIVNPFFHTFGYKAGFLACLMMRATVLPEAVFDARRCMERITKDRVSVFPGAPAIYQSMLAQPDLASFDMSSLRLAVTGAAIIPVSLVNAMRDTLRFQTVITAYGLSETTGTVTMCRHDDPAETIAQTSGRAIPGVEVRIAGADGTTLGPNEPGEIVVRGFNVMKGYFEAPEATKETIDAEGWLHTGDVGTLDERGYIRITDRLKDMFIVGGFNAYPAEIENVMMKHGGFAEVAVIGIPDERLGEVGMAFVVPKAGTSIEPAAVIAWCRENLANYKAPRRVKVLEKLPRNATGKVTKFELRELARA